MRAFRIGFLLVVFASTNVFAEEARDEKLRAAVERALPLIEKGAAGSSAARTCFTCHNQAMPILALREAQKRGYSIDNKVLQEQVAHTAAHLKRGRKNYLKGKGQGGRIVTAGYALLALKAAEYQPTETTAAVASYLLGTQKSLKHWRQPGKRPPSSGSDFTATYVALKGLQHYAEPSHKESVNERLTKVRSWLEKSPGDDTEDRVFRLLSLHAVDADQGVIQEQVKQLLADQRDDGGWAQYEERDSDAYATGSVLVALLTAGGVTTNHDAAQRGWQYLLKTQQDDGSWHVVTRADGFQEYFESGFPHGEDQFISIAGSSWAAWALALATPAPATPKKSTTPKTTEPAKAPNR